VRANAALVMTRNLANVARLPTVTPSSDARTALRSDFAIDLASQLGKSAWQVSAVAKKPIGAELAPIGGHVVGMITCYEL
jgi:hypothetical protein